MKERQEGRLSGPEEKEMKMEKMERTASERLRAALCAEERKLKELLDAIGLDDVPRETVVDRVRDIEESLRRVRKAA